MENDLNNYCVSHSKPPSSLAKELETYTRAAIPGSRMLIGELEASLLAVLIQAGGVKDVLELGTFTGYSALCMAEQLPADGTVTTVDINTGTTAIGQSYWDRSPHGAKITAILRPGVDYLPMIERSFDLIFIDADKVNYPFYVSWAKEHLRPRGMLIIDNALWNGKVTDPNPDAHTKAIQEANRIVASWEGWITSLLPIRDGMMLVTRAQN
ncbi:MAG: O-methyltransferase [Bacteriovoracia bacterium]